MGGNPPLALGRKYLLELADQSVGPFLHIAHFAKQGAQQGGEHHHRQVGAFNH
ncbi:hypothetical protein D3C78_1978050 [compost metagenome]